MDEIVNSFNKLRFEAEGLNKSEKFSKSDQIDQSMKLDQSDKSEKNDKSEKSLKLDKAEKSEKPKKSEKNSRKKPGETQEGRRKIALDAQTKLLQTNKDYFFENPFYTFPTNPINRYSNYFMYGEWMVDVPEDFENSYIVKPCPAGRRALVVAEGGRTIAYTKNGWCFDEFPSYLPGGNYDDCFDATMLDCIFSDIDETFYVLDVLYWKDTSFTKCHTNYRFEFLTDTFAKEASYCMYYSRRNPFRFIPILNGKCTYKYLSNMLNGPMPFHPKTDGVEVDGILFYHKNCYYTRGITPLVGLLRPWMLPEVLDIPVPKYFLKQDPKYYLKNRKKKKSKAKEKKSKETENGNEKDCNGDNEGNESVEASRDNDSLLKNSSNSKSEENLYKFVEEILEDSHGPEDEQSGFENNKTRLNSKNKNEYR